MEQIRSWAPTVLLVILLPFMGWYLSFDRNNLKEADASCNKNVTELCSRVDRLETHYKVTITDMKEDIRDMRDDIKDIKKLLVRTVKQKQEHDISTYGIGRNGR